jgi:hypothetical protein
VEKPIDEKVLRQSELEAEAGFVSLVIPQQLRENQSKYHISDCRTASLHVADSEALL